MIDPSPEQIEAGRAAVLANFHPPTELNPTWHLNPEEVARAVLEAAAGAAPQEPGRIRLHHPDGTAKTNDEIRAEAAALVAAAGAAPRGDDLVERVADTLAYYQCRETNPKADDPRMGYHAFSEEQRAHLRERKAEAAAEIVRMFAAAGAAPKKPAEGVGHREKLVGTCGHSEYCNHRFRLWDRLTHHSNGSRMRGKGSPNEASRVDVVFDWLESEGFVLAAPVQVDEAKLAEVIGWEAPGWDNRKELASLFQDHCAIPDEMTLESIYPALIAVAGCGYELAKEHVLAAAAEHSRGGGR